MRIFTTYCVCFIFTTFLEVIARRAAPRRLDDYGVFGPNATQIIMQQIQPGVLVGRMDVGTSGRNFRFLFDFESEENGKSWLIGPQLDGDYKVAYLPAASKSSHDISRRFSSNFVEEGSVYTDVFSQNTNGHFEFTHTFGVATALRANNHTRSNFIDRPQVDGIISLSGDNAQSPTFLSDAFTASATRPIATLWFQPEASYSWSYLKRYKTDIALAKLRALSVRDSWALLGIGDELSKCCARDGWQFAGQVSDVGCLLRGHKTTVNAEYQHWAVRLKRFEVMKQSSNDNRTEAKDNFSFEANQTPKSSGSVKVEYHDPAIIDPAYYFVGIPADRLSQLFGQVEFSVNCSSTQRGSCYAPCNYRGDDRIRFHFVGEDDASEVTVELTRDDYLLPPNTVNDTMCLTIFKAIKLERRHRRHNDYAPDHRHRHHHSDLDNFIHHHHFHHRSDGDADHSWRLGVRLFQRRCVQLDVGRHRIGFSPSISDMPCSPF